MLDTKSVAGVVLASTAAASTWIEQANAYGQLLVTAGGFIVVCLTAWYTWERANKLRKQRKEKD